jgi:hypothetical protein
MRRIIAGMLGVGMIVALTSGARAQGVVHYPPADGMMYTPPPQYAAPGGLGAQYSETAPAYASGYYATNPYGTQQVVPYAYQPNRVLPRVRGRGARGARFYSRGYNQAPAPYNYSLQQGQPYWPGSSMAPAYTPYSRFQSYGSGYGRGPYGSGFYSGYFRGLPLYWGY